MPRPLIFAIEASITPVQHEFNGGTPDEISPWFKESMNTLIDQWGFDSVLKFRDHDQIMACEILDKHPKILMRECHGDELLIPFPEYLPVRIFKGRKQGDILRLLFQESKILCLKCTGKRKSYFEDNFEVKHNKLIGD